MPQKLTSLADLAALPFDQIIDVRSPAEYAEDHVPGAISLPVLSNAERAEVGTIYVREDRFRARKIGAALLARNAAAHLEGPLADRPGGWRPLVYCWRGGQRSGAFASILAQVGWRADVIEGGYKSYRRLVARALYDTPIASRVILIAGGTGTAKTALLGHLAKAGAQVLDLEGLAAHRGSVFGAVASGQPSQKTFESRLALALAGLDAARPLFVEAESNKIGRILIPPGLWQAMLGADHVEISAPLAARAHYLVTAYDDLLDDPDRLQATIAKLVHYHGHEQARLWQGMAQAGEFQALAGELVARHYDKRYTGNLRRQGNLLAGFDLADLSEVSLASAAADIAQRFGG
ncbi:MAG: tRNA 2-selenouridine(34) synthase MnmH [Rhodobacteraceae bacterium]|nr:tRNA 2-selenouridine(34) synthase MnmH [Paracoccaceae bacterium]